MKPTLTLLLLFIVGSATAQVNFDNYTTLQSAGEIPDDFKKRTYEKLEEDLNADRHQDLSKREQKEFYEGINYAIDDIMHSGYVVFGDPVSLYVQEVADNLLENHNDLKEKLRFYTIKSNNTNAFSTEQGIVFVTTGLISQLTNEAQLAFILAHEISHFTEHHVLESFSYHKNNKSKSIEQMSIYSKEKELDADRFGLELYADAGYSKNEILSVFDVLLYSYLPFDEIEVPQDYFTSNDSLYVPTSLFPTVPYEIEAVEDEDDSKSSHPNIKTRKEKISDEINDISSWGEAVFKLGEDRFKLIQNITRFEVVRNNLHQANYVGALYSVFLLEPNFPDSKFLQRAKAQAWFGILQYRILDDMDYLLYDKSDREGAEGGVHHFINALSDKALVTLSLRQIYDTQIAYPQDEEIQLIYKRALRALGFYEDFELEDYHKTAFKSNQIVEEIIETEEEVEQDSTAVKSKYDRIKNSTSDEEETESLDDANFHYYLIPDIIVDDAFVTSFDEYREELRDEQLAEEEFEALSRGKQKKLLRENRKESLHLGVDNVISVEPIVLSIKARGVDRIKSEKLEETVNEMMTTTADDLDIQVNHVSHSEFDKGGTDVFNERATLFQFLEQTGNNDDADAFPVDFELMKDLQNKYETSNVMFTLVSHEYAPNMDLTDIALAILCYPIAPIYFPIKILSGHNTNVIMLLLDIEEGEIVGVYYDQVKMKLRKHVLGAHMHSMLKTMNTEKK